MWNEKYILDTLSRFILYFYQYCHHSITSLMSKDNEVSIYKYLPEIVCYQCPSRNETSKWRNGKQRVCEHGEGMPENIYIWNESRHFRFWKVMKNVRNVFDKLVK